MPPRPDRQRSIEHVTGVFEGCSRDEEAILAAGDPRERYFTPLKRWTGPGPFYLPFTELQWEGLQGRYEREKEVVGMMDDAGDPFLAGSDHPTLLRQHRGEGLGS